MFRRGRSEEPDFGSRPPIQLQMTVPDSTRARSVGPTLNRQRDQMRAPPRYGDLAQGGMVQSTTNVSDNRATINRNINPSIQFPSMKRLAKYKDLGEIPTVLNSDGLKPDPSRDGDVCSYYFWVIIIFVFVVSLLNLIANVVIFQMFHLTPSFGINYLELIPEKNVLKARSDLVQVDNLVLQEGLVTGFQGQPLVLHGSDGNDILLQLAKFDSDTEEGPVPQLRVSPDGITVSDVEDVRLIHPDTGEILFDFGHPELSVEGPIENLEAMEVVLNKIMSPIGEDLLLMSEGAFDVEGMDGVFVDSKDVKLEAATDFIIDSENTIYLNGSIQIDPRALPLGGSGYPNEEGQFKLCICMPQGTLFRVAVPEDGQGQVSCKEAEDWEYHPCSVK